MCVCASGITRGWCGVESREGDDAAIGDPSHQRGGPSEIHLFCSGLWYFKTWPYGRDIVLYPEEGDIRCDLC